MVCLMDFGRVDIGGLILAILSVSGMSTGAQIDQTACSRLL